MISVTAVTNNYILQPALIEKHGATLNWLSAIMHWKRELAFFRRLLEQPELQQLSGEERQKASCFDCIITFYDDELTTTLRTKLLLHEAQLADSLRMKDETNVSYIKDHDDLMKELESTDVQFSALKEDLFSFIQTLSRLRHTH